LNLPQITNINVELYGLLLASRLKKRIPRDLGSQFATLGANVQAFISNFGPNNKPKMLKVGPQDFLALTPSVKGP
jgi:phage gpG-like protein